MNHEDMVLQLLASGAVRIPDSSPEFASLNQEAREQGYTLLIGVDGTYLAVNPKGEVMPFIVVRQDGEIKGAA